MWLPDPQQVEIARERIDAVFLDTPLLRSPELDRRFGATLIFKDETANPIRSFKGRGACNLLCRLEDERDIVTASAGNFGQGVAWAARSQGRRLVVFSPTNAIASKIEAMHCLGAQVVLTGNDLDDAKAVANSYANEHGLLWIEDGAHAAIAEGAGTIALEAFENNDSVEILLAPMGNGALVAGLGCYAKYRLPFAATIAVASAGAPAMARSVRQGVICTTERVHTIADGIAVRIPIPAAVHAVRNVVDDVVLVDDDDIRRAMQLVEQQLGILAEPAGAAGFAALVAEPERWRGKTIFIALCGGNV